MSMRRFINIDFDQLVYRMLPSHKRLPKRLILFRWPLSLLTDLFTTFQAWRLDVFYRINITGQTLSLQNYLNYAVENANNRILIKDYSDNGIWVQLITEEGESYMIPASLASEEGSTANAALDGEITPLEDVDFYVYIPSEVNQGDVARIVEKYKLAGKRYEIIQN